MTKHAVAKTWELDVIGGRRYSTNTAPAEPESGDAGINSSNQATATTIILDLREDPDTKNYIFTTTGNLPGGEAMLRAPSLTHVADGGFWGSGAIRVVPGDWEDGESAGQHVCGIGSIGSWDTVVGGSGCRQFAIGMLFRFGSGWISEQNGTKEIIVQRSGAGGGGGRPMIVPKWYDPLGIGEVNDIIFPACDDEMCNCTRDPDDDAFGNDGPNPYFDYRDYYDEWCWLELSADLDGNWMRTHIWTADGVHAGTFMAEQDYTESGTSGSFPGLDNLNFLNPVASPTSNCYKEMCYVEFRLGNSSSITPPVGFPGSAR
jgi:hypothetical protein